MQGCEAYCIKTVAILVLDLKLHKIHMCMCMSKLLSRFFRWTGGRYEDETEAEALLEAEAQRDANETEARLEGIISARARDLATAPSYDAFSSNRIPRQVHLALSNERSSYRDEDDDPSMRALSNEHPSARHDYLIYDELTTDGLNMFIYVPMQLNNQTSLEGRFSAERAQAIIEY